MYQTARWNNSDLADVNQTDYQYQFVLDKGRSKLEGDAEAWRWKNGGWSEREEENERNKVMDDT